MDGITKSIGENENSWFWTENGIVLKKWCQFLLVSANKKNDMALRLDVVVVIECLSKWFAIETREQSIWIDEIFLTQFRLPVKFFTEHSFHFINPNLNFF